MNEQYENRPTDLDGWPMPSRDVLRDLERLRVDWAEPDGDAEPVGAAA